MMQNTERKVQSAKCKNDVRKLCRHAAANSAETPVGFVDSVRLHVSIIHVNRDFRKRLAYLACVDYLGSSGALVSG